MKLTHVEELPQKNTTSKAKRVISDFMESCAKVALITYEQGEKPLNNASFRSSIKTMNLEKSVEVCQRNCKQYLTRID